MISEPSISKRYHIKYSLNAARAAEQRDIVPNETR